MPVRALGFNNFPEAMEKSKVRRCLFGKPDHDSLRRDLDIQLKNTRTEMRSTWNFDADLDKPLDGRYEWTLIKEEDYVPAFYSKGYRPTKFRKRLDLSPSEACDSQSSHQQCVTPLRTELQYDNESDDDLQRENETTPELVTQRQSRIDEHYPKVKRCKRRLSHSSSSDEENSVTEERNTKLRKLE